ncbi:tail fiber protein [Sedimentibacter hydroxybenzoicus DSM 7310]|uniref:Tail fiber protein n=1 Tax=Sedimentibacter hydroxybenzoicus DSM 7310 TaxID=1123245 RepID=A0A974BIK2_SEDHY|nr:tail fiber protein [Sedimentibacter hydroxybenzoicus]NYB73849.1 tail fiber protein [Sedimentibacter hydroxybenzoicus DSM 7310]
MTVKSGFFNSIGGDRKYDAARFAEYFGSFIGNGIFPEPENSLKVIANNDMTVAVQVGKAWINGYFLVNDDNYILTIENADGTLNRIDRIVARYDVIDREIRLEVKKGTFSSSPVAPDIQRDSDSYELALADVYINAGATSIIHANITDLRNNSDYCGIVDSLIAGNVNLLSDRIDAIDIVLPNKLEKTGEGKDITVTFTEAAIEADIASGEKLSVMFGKILKKFKNIISGTTAVGKAITLNGLTATIAELNFVKGVTSAIQTQLNSKAPTNHASTGTSYGVGTAANYGHVKLSDATNNASGVSGGIAATPLAIKNVNEKIDSKNPAPLRVTGNLPINAPITDIVNFDIVANPYKRIIICTDTGASYGKHFIFLDISYVSDTVIVVGTYEGSSSIPSYIRMSLTTSNQSLSYQEIYMRKSGNRVYIAIKGDVSVKEYAVDVI